MQYIIKADGPFKGHCESVLTRDGRVAYTGRLVMDENGKTTVSECLTLAEYEAREGCKMRVIGESEMADLMAAHIDSQVTAPKAITRKDFDYALGVLPPCRWHNVAGFNVFHVSERITADLVSWYAAGPDGRCWSFDDRYHISDADLAAKLRAI